MHLDSVTPDLALVADRWGLKTLFDALFLHAEQQSAPISSSPSNTGMLIVKFLPIMAVVDVPERFKRFLAMRLALNLIEVDEFFETCDERPDMDDVCNVQHEPGVACKRRKLDCVMTDNASDASTVPTRESTIEEGENSCKDAEGVTMPDSVISKTASGDAQGSGNCSHGETTRELFEGAVSLDASGSEANGIHIGEEENVGEATGGNDQGETSGGIESSSHEHDCDGDGGEEVVEVVERIVSAVLENGEGENADDGGVGEGASGDQSAEEGEGVNAEDGGGEEVNGEVEGGEEVNGEVGEEVDGGNDADVANEDEAENEDDIGDLVVLPEPCVPPPPYPVERKAWHKEFDVWKVFQQRKMMRLFIHYLSHYGALDYRMFLLDIVLAQLEPTIDNDDEVIDLLCQIDWFWEGPTCEMLSGDATANWSPRAWRLCALAQLSKRPAGIDIRMNWTYHNLFSDIREKAAQLANKNDDSDANSSNSSDDEQEPGFSASWDGRAGDQGFEFEMKLQCDDPDIDELAPLNLTIRLLERGEEGLDKKSGRREVTLRIKVIECGCGCALGDGDEYQGFTVSSTRSAEERVERLESFRNGNKYVIIEGDKLVSWMKRHKLQCGLLFQVRLCISPDTESERKCEDSNEGRTFECMCGFCNTGSDEFN